MQLSGKIELDDKPLILDSPQTLPKGTKITGIPGVSKIIVPPGPQGPSLSIHSSDVELSDFELDGGGLWIDINGPGMNGGIKVNNVDFNLATRGGDSCNGITFTSGLEESAITNCLFRGTCGFGIYGYNYRNLEIANNEFANIVAGAHIDGRSIGDDLIVRENWLHGLKGMGLEFQGSGARKTFLDNFYELPRLSSVFHENDGCMAFSLILDNSSDILIARNTVLAPERPDGTGCRVGFEVGGDNCLVTDNLVDGINHVLADNDGVGSSSVTVSDNRFLNYLIAMARAFGAPNRIFTVEGRNDAFTPLTWNIDRGRPHRNTPYVIVQPDPIPTPEPPIVIPAPPVSPSEPPIIITPPPILPPVTDDLVSVDFNGKQATFVRKSGKSSQVPANRILAYFDKPRVTVVNNGTKELVK